MASFFITVVFLQYNSTVGKLRCNGLLIEQRPVEQTAYRKGIVTMDINPSLQILDWYVKGTGLW